MGDVVMYDGLVSLFHDLELVLRSHNRVFGSDWSCSCGKQEIQIVYDGVSAMVSLLIDSDYNLMENDIISAVHYAQGYVDSCVNGCCSYPYTENQTGIANIWLLHSIIKCIDSIRKSTQLTLPLPDTVELFAVRSPKTGNQDPVDFVGSTKVNVSKFPIGEPGLNIFAVTGTEERGKATFIGRVYDHLLEFFHFDVHAWIAIERGDEVRHVLIRLLSCIDSFDYKINYNSAGNDELALRLYYRLMDRRSYLIVLDDLYDSTIWDYLKRFFPDRKNGCGIVILTSATHKTPHAPRHYSSVSSNVETLTRNVRDGASTSVEDITPAGYRTPEEDKLVGLEKDLLTMLDHLTGHPLKLKVFAVTGMGGIGKTTFTKRLYDDPLVMHHFNCRAWFTISQQYRVREVLIGLLRCLTDVVTEINEQSNGKLSEQLKRSLQCKRYLIVLDDMWDNNAWDDLKLIFSDDKNGSRILLTSRLEDVAIHASPDTPPHCLSFLREEESWELLQSKIFAKESCPLELEVIGKQIAGKCHGLPLAIVVVGGLLSKMNKTLEVWKQFAQSVSSRVMEKAEHCKNILALSYNHLPHHLKVCFLYMGIFPEDYVIPVQTVIWLWIAEGFIRPLKVKSLEELAEEYLEDLISRNLIMVKRRKPGSRSKICIHDLLRDLCLTESQNQNFFHAFGSVNRQDFPWEMQRRLCFQSNIPDDVITSSFPYIRSFLWFSTLTLSSNEKFLSMNFKLLKVMNIRNLHLKELPRKILGLAHLRYLSMTFQDSIDRSIFSSKLHNLQILIIESDWNGRLPKEFWDMSEIRHLQFKRCFLSYWPNESRPNILQLSSASESLQPFICQLQIAEHPLKVLHNLQSLTTIRPISCTKNVFLSMPNLKKLGIYENEEDNLFRGWFKNLIYLQELQTLKYIRGDRFIMKPDPLPSPEFFPPKLTKLTLKGTSLPWEDMIKLSELPNLEVLKLKNYAFSGAIWKSEDGGFPGLKYLLIGKTNLHVWEADGSHFPSLQHLVMMDCRSLKEIPCSIGEAPLLEKIELYHCSESAATSAQQIQIEQQNSGNDGLTVNISKWLVNYNYNTYFGNDGLTVYISKMVGKL